MEKIGKYELREVLGRGGMGTVYRAYDPVIDREVAVKIIHDNAVSSPELKARFTREARTAGKFSHDNITVIHDLGELDGKLFIVMEFLQGRDLRSIIDRKEPLSLADKLNYARQICKGLRYAHANGIVHRDIKPENIKILPDGRIKIMDFGIAKPYVAPGTVAGDDTGPVLTQVGMRIGTPWYMSPEQVKGSPVDKRSDIFSFGVLLYELLTYQKPFTGNDTTVLYKILHEEPEPIRLEESGLGTSLQRILSKCLAKSVDDRYADCLLILRDIENAPGGGALPRIVPELLQEAEELNRQQRLNEAAQKFTEVLEVDPQNPVARASIERLTVVMGENTIPAGGSPEQAIGQVVSHFRIIERISGGGMGVVYKAEDLTLKRIVALKFLQSDWTRNPVAKKRFLKEAQTASSLDHPNVCTIHEIGETLDGLLFICMAFYEGEDLSSRIREGPLPLDQAITIISGAARGLGKAHEHGILHRDVKPGNILITRSGVVKILDFGVAKLSSGTQITRAGSLVGTLPYMSPEQIKGLELDQRSDIWSLGVVLYQALAGKVPFDDSNEAALFYSIVNQDVPPITSERKDLPPALDRLLARALAKKPEDRHPSMRDFLADLESIPTGPRPAPAPTGRRLEEVASLLEKGKAHLRRKEYDEALTRFEAALRIEPKDREILDLKNEIAGKKEEHQKALALVREGERRLAEGKAREARKNIQAALALDPELPSAAKLLEQVVEAIAADDQVDRLLVEAEVSLKRQRPEDAAAAYQKILQLRPNHKEALRGLEKTGKGTAKQGAPAKGAGSARRFPIGLVAGGAGLLVVAIGLWLLLQPGGTKPTATTPPVQKDTAQVAASTRDEPQTAKSAAEGADTQARDSSLLAAAADINQLKTMVGEARRTMLTSRRSAEQAGAQQLSRDVFSGAAQLEQQANSLSGSGNRDDLIAARNFYTTAREGFTRAAREAREIVLLRKDADAAITAMRRSKQRVTGSDAEKQASPSYRRALETESRATQRFQEAMYPESRDASQQAERLFADAGNEIAAARTQARTATATPREPPADVPAREPERKDPAAKERELKDAAQRTVRKMLDEYRQAIEQGNLRNLGALLPLNAEAQRRWSLFFGNTEDRKVTAELLDVEINGETAHASFRWKISFQSANTPQSQDIVKHWDLQSEAGTWKIVKER